MKSGIITSEGSFSLESKPTNQGARYSLNSLLWTFALLSVCFAAFVWIPKIGILLSIAVPGIVLVIIGLCTDRRVETWLGGILIFGAAGLFLLNQMLMIFWVGSHKLEVHVHVVDASSLEPIPNARLEVLRGQPSPIVGSKPDVARDFEIVPLLSGAEELETDGQGYIKFTHKFFSAGSASLLGRSGYVDTNNIWLRVTASGYSTTYMPIDKQSMRPRDIGDETPLYVTVPVGKK